ncbi:MAG: hypothetical protein HRT74_04460 [Flavobacteriales bacterium]|nr:hypothetical protein [Flavobacteriales bacterium]
MKTLSLCVALLCFSFIGSSAIINVNNSTPSPGEFDNMADAIAAASPGDTIYVAPTSVNYGDVDVDKQLSIIGPGYNVNAGVLGNAANFQIITLTSADCSGSIIEGVRFDRFYLGGSLGDVSNVQIKINIVDEYLWPNSSDLEFSLIEGNVFLSGNQNLFTSDFNNCTLRNNIFNGSVNSFESGEISNNLFLGATGSQAIFLPGNVTNSVVSNNILIGRNPANAPINNVFNGNCSFEAGNTNPFPNGTNLIETDPEFIDATLGFFDFAFDYTLSASSPLLDAGTDGVEVGIYGGDGVYRLDGEPSIPIIRSVNVPEGNSIPANSPFTINIISVIHE